MKILQSSAQWVTAINRYFAYGSAFLVLAITLIIIYDVICRYFFDQPTVWAMELSTMLFGPYFLFSGAYILNQRGHVSVDIFYAKMSPQWQRYADRLFFTTVIALCVIVIWMSIPIALDSFSQKETSFSSWNQPIWPLNFVIPFAFVQLFLQALAEIIFSFNREEA